MLDTLLEQIAAGTGNLRSQVIHLTESLDANQRELREAKEQLAEANRASEGHNELVESLRAEIEGLKDDLARSRSQADATTARLRELVRTVQALTLEEEDASALGATTEDNERERPGRLVDQVRQLACRLPLGTSESGHGRLARTRRLDTAPT